MLAEKKIMKDDYSRLFTKMINITSPMQDKILQSLIPLSIEDIKDGLSIFYGVPYNENIFKSLADKLMNLFLDKKIGIATVVKFANAGMDRYLVDKIAKIDMPEFIGYYAQHVKNTNINKLYDAIINFKKVEWIVKFNIIVHLMGDKKTKKALDNCIKSENDEYWLDKFKKFKDEFGQD